MSKPNWRCPNCRSTDLRVEARVVVKLYQEPDGSNFETEPVGDHEWDGASWMFCNDCEYCGQSHTFEVK